MATAEKTRPAAESKPKKPQAAPPPVEQQPEQQLEPPQQPEVAVDDDGAFAAYTNFARVTGTPEEVIVDFGLNPRPLATDHQEIKVGQRLTMNHFTAKLLLTALGMTVQRHEGAFGPLELDVNRRVHCAPTNAAS